ncbi:thioredoxin fold domain-containing protein [Altererythrobacter salegens]|uniref:Thioredoxin fold domain-containing protein n=1 Tax=Croceibacterium salegens TaxID=1737568 RepID=A0A6I4SZN5_9SPHN|nr:thioredoxin family protein [Croceibacterium salegens]MXO59772.1 thioredoxin fold domain-containing protein [Croceibacterium salegens]
MRSTTVAVALALALATAACQNAGDQAELAQASEIAWRHGDVADALAEAKEAGKPVILYWGAVWCPPCNQMKATLFRDPEFIAETQNFIPVYLDGDTEGAQRWGEQFGISGYPTVIILQPDGTEITRIASATMAGELPKLLEVAAKRTTSIETLLAKAENNTANLDKEDWTILGGFDWMNDPKHFSDLTKAGTLLGRLAQSAPTPELKRRFGLLSLAVEADGKLTEEQQAQTERILGGMLEVKSEILANRQELTFYAPDLVNGMSPGEARDRLAGELVKAGDTIFAADGLSLTDRVDAVNIDITLAKADGGKVPADVLAKVRKRAKWADANAKDKQQRQSVMDDAAYRLKDAGDIEGGRKILLAELEKSESPYYYMSSLADFAEEQGKSAEAIDWAQKAYEASQGPATRVQWAISWSGYVMRLTPQDKKAVETSAQAVLGELAKNQDGYFQRTRVKIDKWGKTLSEWAAANGGSEVLDGLRTEMAELCTRQGGQADSCSSWAKA